MEKFEIGESAVTLKKGNSSGSPPGTKVDIYGGPFIGMEMIDGIMCGWENEEWYLIQYANIKSIINSGAYAIRTIHLAKIPPQESKDIQETRAKGKDAPTQSDIYKMFEEKTNA